MTIEKELFSSAAFKLSFSLSLRTTRGIAIADEETNDEEKTSEKKRERKRVTTSSKVRADVLVGALALCTTRRTYRERKNLSVRRRGTQRSGTKDE